MMNDFWFQNGSIAGYGSILRQKWSHLLEDEGLLRQKEVIIERMTSF
jgi:hypothetical protein